MTSNTILPGTGRWLAAGQTEGAIPQSCAPIAPSTACGGPPPRAGEELA